MALQTNLTRFKEPRGFIKIIEFLIAILAFSTTAGYSGEFTATFTYACSGNTSSSGVKGKFDYPFDNWDAYTDALKCNETAILRLRDTPNDLPSSVKSSAEFFVFVGVISFLYSIIAMVYYVCFEDPATYGRDGSGRQLASFATVDFVVTIVLALFWFCGSAAWAAGYKKLSDETDVEDICRSDVSLHQGLKCEVDDKANYAALTISVLFGFLSCFLWCANTWFVFKETMWHKERSAAETAVQSSDEVPHQEVPGEVVP